MSLTDRKKILPLEVKTLKNQCRWPNTRQIARKDIVSAQNFAIIQDLPSTIES
jgi:hypothetical protein